MDDSYLVKVLANPRLDLIVGTTPSDGSLEVVDF